MDGSKIYDKYCQHCSMSGEMQQGGQRMSSHLHVVDVLFAYLLLFHCKLYILTPGMSTPHYSIKGGTEIRTQN